MSLEIYGLYFSKTDPTAYQCKKSAQNFMKHIRNKYIFKGYMPLKQNTLEKSDFTQCSRNLRNIK